MERMSNGHVYVCTHFHTAGWAWGNHSSTNIVEMRQGCCMVSDCIHHRAGGPEFSHALELTSGKTYRPRDDLHSLEVRARGTSSQAFTHSETEKAEPRWWDESVPTGQCIQIKQGGSIHQQAVNIQNQLQKCKLMYSLWHKNKGT